MDTELFINIHVNNLAVFGQAMMIHKHFVIFLPEQIEMYLQANLN